ncbi:fimbrial protein [Pseudomonas chlororaphis subsp. piscium]
MKTTAPFPFPSKEAGSRKQEAGSRKQEAGSRKQEAGSRKQEAGSRKQEAGSRKQEAGSRKQEAGSRKHYSATFIAQQLCVIAFMALAASPSASALDAFGQALSIPKNTAAGTILARHYITPREVCGESKCTVKSITVFPNGGGSSSTETVITTNVSGISTSLLINGKAYGSSYPYPLVEFTRPIEVQLLSDGRPNLGGSLAGIHSRPGYYTVTTEERSYNLEVYLKGTITPIDGTCSVPSQTVKLPTTLLNRLDSIGSTAGTQSFQIKINNCPRGYNRVGYTLDPAGGVIENSPGVLPLAGGSTASGIKIRVENAQGAPATMGSSITVDGYRKAVGGSFAIPMQASYIRTDTVAKPGTVKGAMTVLMDYR